MLMCHSIQYIARHWEVRCILWHDFCVNPCTYYGNQIWWNFKENPHSKSFHRYNHLIILELFVVTKYCRCIRASSGYPEEAGCKQSKNSHQLPYLFLFEKTIRLILETCKKNSTVFQTLILIYQNVQNGQFLPSCLSVDSIDVFYACNSVYSQTECKLLHRDMWPRLNTISIMHFCLLHGFKTTCVCYRDLGIRTIHSDLKEKKVGHLTSPFTRNLKNCVS